MKHLCSQINFGEMKVRCLRQENTDYSSGLLDVVQANVSATLLAALALSPPDLSFLLGLLQKIRRVGTRAWHWQRPIAHLNFTTIYEVSSYVGHHMLGLQYGPTLKGVPLFLRKKKVHILLHTAETQKLFIA